MTRDLGSSYQIDETSFRPYFGCSSTLAASGATERLLRDLGIDGSDVAAIEIRCHPVVAKDNFEPNPNTLPGARLSMHFNVGLVLARGGVVTGDVGADRLWRHSSRHRMTKVRKHANP